jgi:hypothetical protein
MANPKKSIPTKGRAAQAITVTDQLCEIMGHFNEARSLVIVCQHSLESLELALGGDESEALLVAVELLGRTYNDLDRFAGRCSELMRSAKVADQTPGPVVCTYRSGRTSA